MNAHYNVEPIMHLEATEEGLVCVAELHVTPPVSSDQTLKNIALSVQIQARKNRNFAGGLVSGHGRQTAKTSIITLSGVHAGCSAFGNTEHDKRTGFTIAELAAQVMVRNGLPAVVKMG